MGQIWLNMSIILVSLLLHFHVFSFLIWKKNLFKIYFWTNLAILSQIWDYNCITIFPKPIFFGFLFLVSYCLETCVNRFANWVMQKFTPLRFKLYKLFFFYLIFWTMKQFFHTYEPLLSKHFFKLDFFDFLRSMCSAVQTWSRFPCRCWPPAGQVQCSGWWGHRKGTNTQIKSKFSFWGHGIGFILVFGH